MLSLPLKLVDENPELFSIFLLEGLFLFFFSLQDDVPYLNIVSKELRFFKTVVQIYVYLHSGFLRLTIITTRCTKRGKWVEYHRDLRNKIMETILNRQHSLGGKPTPE